jgi:hypothetical protein
VIAYYSPREYDALRLEIEKLAEGDLDERVRDFLAGRQEFSKSTREDQKAHLENRQDMKTRLMEVPEDQLETWLAEQIL